jgi:hypothetical protein
MPTVGIGTLESLGAAGARVLAIEAEKTILVDAAVLLDFAERKGITIVSVPDGITSPTPSSGTSNPPAVPNTSSVDR